MATAIDVGSIAAFASVATKAVSTILEAPTVELVNSLLQGIATRVQEYEALKAQKYRTEVELESAVRTNESKTKVLRNTADKALAESSKLRAELQKSGETTYRRA
jgi:nucleoprotein TPR